MGDKRSPPTIRRTGSYTAAPSAPERKHLPLPKYRPFYDEWKQRVKPYISREELVVVAYDLEVSYPHVRKVYAGTAVSAPVVRGITEQAIYNRKHGTTYPEQQPAYEQMCILWDGNN